MKVFILESSFQKKSITIAKNLGYFRIMNNHLSHLDFIKEEETEKKVVLIFKTTSNYVEGFHIISELENT